MLRDGRACGEPTFEDDPMCPDCSDALEEEIIQQWAKKKGWLKIRRGHGPLSLSTLGRGEFVTASGFDDGDYIIWRKADHGQTDGRQVPIPSGQSSENESVDKKDLH
jgi:hypothetical protein